MMTESELKALQLLVSQRNRSLLLAALGSFLLSILLFLVIGGLLFLLLWAICLRLGGSAQWAFWIISGVIVATVAFQPLCEEEHPALQEIPERDFNFFSRSSGGDRQLLEAAFQFLTFGAKAFWIGIRKIREVLRLRCIAFSELTAVIEPLLRNRSQTLYEISDAAGISAGDVKSLLVLLDAVVWLRQDRQLAAALSSTWRDPLS